MNRPYIKQYSNGILINPIDGFFPSKTVRPEFPNGFPNRRERRAALNRKNRMFNNKKGVQLVVTRVGLATFSKYKKRIQKIGNKSIVHYTGS